MQTRLKLLASLVFSPDVFKPAFYVMSILGVCPLVAPAVEPFLKLFHVYAFAVILFDVFGEQRIFRNKGRFLLVLFGLCYAVTLLTNTNLINFSGLSNFCYLLAELGIVYSYGKNSERIDRISGTVICTAISMANVVGIWMFFEKYYLYVPKRGYIGIFPYENRLAGLFGNPNVLGMICLGAICLSGILFCSSSRGRDKLYFGVLGFVNVITLLLSNSRTQIYSVVFMCAVLVFMLVLKPCRNLKRFSLAIVAAVLTVFFVFTGFKLVQQGMSMFDHKYDYYLQNICVDENRTSAQPMEDVPPMATDATTPNTNNTQTGSNNPQTIQRNQSTDLNGRLGLWRSGLKIISAKPLFGGGLDNHNYVLSSIGLPKLPVNGNLHNVYLEVLASFGVLGFACFVAFLLIMLGNVIAYFKYNDGGNWTLGAVYLACVAAFMMDGLADSTLVASFYPTAVAFWYIASQFANLLEVENMRTGHYRKDLLCRISERVQTGIKEKR